MRAYVYSFIRNSFTDRSFHGTNSGNNSLSFLPKQFIYGKCIRTTTAANHPGSLRVTSGRDPGATHRKSTRHVARARVPSDRKSTRLNSSHVAISYAVFCLKKKQQDHMRVTAST